MKEPNRCYRYFGTVGLAAIAAPIAVHSDALSPAYD